MGSDDHHGSTNSPAPSPSAGPAWLLRDVTHVPGVLSLDGDRWRFVSTRRVVFDATPDELALATSRTRRGRFRLTVDGERVSLSVVRPAGAVAVPTELLARTPGGHGAPGDDRVPDEDEVTERWERLLVAGATGRRHPDAAARPRRRVDRRAARRRPRGWRAVTALARRVSLD